MSANKPLTIEPADFSPSNEQAEYLKKTQPMSYLCFPELQNACHN